MSVVDAHLHKICTYISGKKNDREREPRHTRRVLDAARCSGKRCSCFFKGHSEWKKILFFVLVLSRLYTGRNQDAAAQYGGQNKLSVCLIRRENMGSAQNGIPIYSRMFVD